MAENTWWHGPLRVIQYNLQMKDSPRMDAEKMARETAAMGANAAAVNVIDSVVWYRTAVPFFKVNPYLPETGDWLAELISAFHRCGVKVFARIGIWAVEEETYYQKPHWVLRSANGAPVMMGDERPGGWHRLYRCCPGSSFLTEGEGLDVVREALLKYNLDGVFWLGSMDMGENCWCGYCQSRYYEMTGTPMPSDPLLLHPGWREAALRESAARFYEQVQKTRPNIPFLRYYFPFALTFGTKRIFPPDNMELVAKHCNMLCTEAQDVLSLGVAQLPAWNTPALRMKMGRSVAGHPPPVGIIHACPGMDWRHTCMPAAEWMYWAAQVPANGGSLWASLTGFAATIADKRMLKALARLNGMIADSEHAMRGAQSDCQVLLLSDGGVHVQGWAEALMCAHIDFDMLAHYQFCGGRLKKYALVIAPKNFAYPAEAGAALQSYVEAGGKLIVEGTEAQALWPVLGLLGVAGGAITCGEDLAAAYLRTEPSCPEIQRRLGNCDLVPLRGRVGFCEPGPGTQVLATWVPPFASVAAAGMPPERASLPVSHTRVPLCMVSARGKGKVMFLPYEPSRLVHEYALRDMFALMGAYVEHLLGNGKTISIDAPHRVMATVFAKDNRQMLHLVNGLGQRPLAETVPCHGIGISIRLRGRAVQSVVSQIAKRPLEYAVLDDVLTISLPRLDVWDMLLIEYAPPDEKNGVDIMCPL